MTIVVTKNSTDITVTPEQVVLEIGTTGLQGPAGTTDYTELENKPTLGTAAAKDVAPSGDASSVQVVTGNDSRLTDARTPTAHTQSESSITNLIADLAAKSAVGHTHTKSDITDFPVFGTVASKDIAPSGDASSTQVVMGNDTRLSDARTPTAHTQSESSITNLIADLAAKSAVGHTHTKAEITDFPLSLPASDVFSWAKSPTQPAPIAHTHAEADVAGLVADLAGKASLAGATFTGNLNVNVPNVENVGHNKYYPLLLEAGNVVLQHQNFYWNGSTYIATNSYGFGLYALQNNTGADSYGFGLYALQNNTGDRSDGFGSYALQNNTGYYSNGFGSYALQNNTGAVSDGFGFNALQNNTGAYSDGFGFNALRFNNWPYAISIGREENPNYFLDNPSSAQSFATANITANTITFSATHGFGPVGRKINLRFTTLTGTPPTGLVSNTVYQFTVTSTTVLTLAGIGTNASGDFTGKVTNSVDITNSIAIGYNTNASKPNQVVLGNSSVTEVDAGTAGCATLLAKKFQLSALNTAPASSSDIGTTGEVRFCAGYAYLCVAPNTWQRAAFATF